jgi:hypothetical protein
MAKGTPAARSGEDSTSTATIGFEARLWLAADSRGEAEPERSGDSQPQAARRANAVRQTAEGNRSNNMDAAETSGANRVERDRLHEVQPARAGAAAHGKQPAAGSPEGERGGVHQFGVPPMTALRDSAFPQSEGTPQVVSAARDNNANFAWVQRFKAHSNFHLPQ